MDSSITLENKSNLIKKALEANKNSYAPYSNFKVSAALLTESNNIYTGVNVENASYPAGICAERSAISSAISAGERYIKAIAICGGMNGIIKDYCYPCGICRQVLREFNSPENLLIILVKDENNFKEIYLNELLPFSFGPDSLI